VTWLFVSYPLLVAAITYFWRKHACWRCICRTKRCCRESVTVGQASSSSLSPSLTLGRRQRVAEVQPSYVSPSRPISAGDRPVPVLFATPHGLHVRSTSMPNQPLESVTAVDHRAPTPGEDEKSADDARKCDVFGSVLALQSEDNCDNINTSDYDSGTKNGTVDAMPLSISVPFHCLYTNQFYFATFVKMISKRGPIGLCRTVI